ncbi:ToxR-activated gene A protein [Vibrio cholerae]|nr:ToxR-activated gene A protein [Vibrio cholerae]
MKSGMSLHFEDENGNLGIIESERIKFSAPSELIITIQQINESYYRTHKYWIL